MMPSSRALLFGAMLASAIGTVVGGVIAPDAPKVLMVGGIMTSVLLALIAWSPRQPLSMAYRVAVSAAILLSLVGLLLGRVDDAASWRSLLAFAAGQLCYLFAFSTQAPVFSERAAVVAYAIVATGLLALLLPTVGGTLRGVLIASVLVASAMGAQGASWLLHAPRSTAARLAAVGSACLVSAHGLLLLDSFSSVVPARTVLVVGGYWLAHGCLAASVERPSAPTLRL